MVLTRAEGLGEPDRRKRNVTSIHAAGAQRGCQLVSCEVPWFAPPEEWEQPLGEREGAIIGRSRIP